MLKKDPYVIAAVTLLCGGLVYLCASGRIGWDQLLAGLGLLFVPSVLGKPKAES